MPLNPMIPLLAEAPDVLGSFTRGTNAADVYNKQQQEKGKRNFLQEYGEELFAGDQNALSAYAEFDLEGAQRIQATQQAQAARRAAAGRAAGAAREKAEKKRVMQHLLAVSNITEEELAMVPEADRAAAGLPSEFSEIPAYMQNVMDQYDLEGAVERKIAAGQPVDPMDAANLNYKNAQTENLRSETEARDNPPAELDPDIVEFKQALDAMGIFDPEERKQAFSAKFGSPPDVPEFSGNVPDGYMFADPKNPRAGIIPIPGYPGAEEGEEGFAIATEILPDGATIQATSAGGVIVKDPAGNIVEGQARLDVLEQSRETEGDLARVIAGEKEAGKVAIQLSKEAFESLAAVNKNLANLQQVITILDESGRITGPATQLLPNISAGAVELENVRNKLALDVVGSVRFGALSKGELDLAQDVALPTKLNPVDLRIFVKERMDAQAKYAQYLAEAATFLGIPGNTVSDWIVHQSDAKRAREAQRARDAKRARDAQRARDARPPGTSLGASSAPEGTMAQSPNGETIKVVNGEWLIQ